MRWLYILYAAGDFAGMLWTGYHSLVTIGSFWLALALFYILASHAQHKRARMRRDALLRAMHETRE